jgi:hypothetical protein
MPRGKPFRKGASGNPAGKRKGTRHKTTRAVETLLDGEAEALTRKAVELAKAGDTVALRLCLERISPPRKDRPVSFTLRPIACVADVADAMADIVSAVADGMLTPQEAGDIAKILDSYIRALDVTDVERRLSTLEANSAEATKGR